MRYLIWLTLATVLIAVVGLISAAAWDRHRGAAYVSEQCAKDGGEKIYESVFTDGYLSSSRSADCIECKDYLPKKLFEYIEIHVDERGAIAGIPGPGNYQYTVSEIGDPRCSAFETSQLFRQTKQSWGFTENQCLAVEQLGEPVAKYGWAAKGEWSNPGRLEGLRGKAEFVVYEIATQKVLGKHVDYFYTTWVSRFFGLFAGSANPDFACTRSPWVDSTGLLLRTLRKRP